MNRFLLAALVLVLADGAATPSAVAAGPSDSSSSASRPAEAGPLAFLLLSRRSAEAAELLEAYRRGGTPEGELQGLLCRVGGALVAQGLSASTVNDRLREIDANAPLQLGADVVRPRVLDHPTPLYTPEAREARVQGAVILQLVVAVSGEVLDAKVMKGLPMGLSQEAIEAVRQWRFEPATLQGSPVPSCYAVDVNFRLPAEPEAAPGPR
jgi:TonB family protein